ncbi:OmpA family protein, partial [Ameyamaea chiangmaiensis]
QRHAGDSAAHPVLRSAPLPPIPPAPPPQPVFVAPSLYVPLHSFPIPDDVPAVKDAKGGAAAIEGGQRLTFAAGSADLSPAMRQAVLDFAADLSAHPDARADVDSYAGGTSDDLSTPRRLSLTRGLSVRAILIHAGIASTRIYVRPIGLASATDTPVATGADAPADHLDLTRSDLVPTHAPPAPGTPATPSQEATP